jgi:hypothetical protein
MSSQEAVVKNFLTSKQLAERWQMHPGSLANWRVQGKGPKFVRFGMNQPGAAKALYPLSEVEAFEAKHLRKNTA